jgi:hypothetical protein
MGDLLVETAEPITPYIDGEPGHLTSRMELAVERGSLSVYVV